MVREKEKREKSVCEGENNAQGEEGGTRVEFRPNVCMDFFGSQLLHAHTTL